MKINIISKKHHQIINPNSLLKIPRDKITLSTLLTNRNIENRFPDKSTETRMSLCSTASDVQLHNSIIGKNRYYHNNFSINAEQGTIRNKGKYVLLSQLMNNKEYIINKRMSSQELVLIELPVLKLKKCSSPRNNMRFEYHRQTISSVN